MLRAIYANLIIVSRRKIGQPQKAYCSTLKKIFNTVLLTLCGYADADWANCMYDTRSYTGFYFTLTGGPISWECKKQPTVALSPTEAII